MYTLILKQKLSNIQSHFNVISEIPDIVHLKYQISPILQINTQYIYSLNILDHKENFLSIRIFQYALRYRPNWAETWHGGVGRGRAGPQEHFS